MYLLFAPSEIVHAFLSSAAFFQNQFFRKILSEIPSECQTDPDQARRFVGPGLVPICLPKGYEQTTLIRQCLKGVLNLFAKVMSR